MTSLSDKKLTRTEPLRRSGSSPVITSVTAPALTGRYRYAAPLRSTGPSACATEYLECHLDIVLLHPDQQWGAAQGGGDLSTLDGRAALPPLKLRRSTSAREPIEAALARSLRVRRLCE